MSPHSFSARTIGRRSAPASVRWYSYAVLGLEVGVDEQHPWPRPEDEVEAGPGLSKHASHARELLERAKAPVDASPRVRGQAVALDK